MLEHRSRKARSYKTVAVPVCLNAKAVYLRLVSSPINGSVPRCLRSVRHLSRAHDRRLNYGDQFQRRRPAVPSTANSTTAPAVIPVADRSSDFPFLSKNNRFDEDIKQRKRLVDASS
ncbi:Hypothetical protein CINCED_3A021067 [Cinara cedri]|uniref:Uncharacterized protein n=1 Tax=Cinara cedri TaxID=506608 RepID=A0A5E4N2K8_9HEMI|nr:Hypothetical protein CINCED_3A021067 [Cinara cedri]